MKQPRVFDPSPTGSPRRLYEPEERAMSTPVRVLIAAVAVVVGGVVAGVAMSPPKAQQPTGRKWA